MLNLPTSFYLVIAIYSELSSCFERCCRGFRLRFGSALAPGRGMQGAMFVLGTPSVHDGGGVSTG